MARPPHVVDNEPIAFSIGTVAAKLARQAADPRMAEFRAFSQFGEDGIIQWLIARVPVTTRRFIELGVDDYRESNTRFLLEHDNWAGTAIDAGDAHIRYVRSRDLAWRHTIDCVTAFVTVSNVNDLVGSGDIGLLSIDIDGNDYWVWRAITDLRPRIVICEYNSLFGPHRPVSIPYTPEFNRLTAHYSGLYFGASLPALEHLATQKGYRLVCSNQAGNNAFFVREDISAKVQLQTAAEAWVQAQFREARDVNGHLTFATADRATIADMPLVEVDTGRTITVGEIVA